MSMISLHALSEYKAKENQQVEITSSVRTVNIFQALWQSPFLPSRDFYPLETQGVFNFSLFSTELYLLKLRKMAYTIN